MATQKKRFGDLANSREGWVLNTLKNLIRSSTNIIESRISIKVDWIRSIMPLSFGHSSDLSALEIEHCQFSKRGHPRSCVVIMTIRHSGTGMNFRFSLPCLSYIHMYYLAKGRKSRDCRGS